MTARTARAGTAATLLSLLATSALAQAPGMDSAFIDKSCGRDCLFGFVDDYLEALGARDPSAAPVSEDVMFTENNVVLPLGDGLWRTIDQVRDGEMRAADPQTGRAVYFGTVQELGNPAFYTMLIKVDDQEITEVETIVVRMPDAPKPFGNPDNPHAPEWDEIIPEDERLERVRLRAIADGYFDTVELNDGQVFTAFSQDCGRLENGISTTSASNGFGAAATTPGCEAQFHLGMYRINKRIRERRYPLIDEERGIVVATGFFDHNNWFDSYYLNDGRTMNTALVWPNSISLIEAFRIKKGDPIPLEGAAAANIDPDSEREPGRRLGEIQRIEATFTYVPYSMHNPFAGPEAQLPPLPPAPGGAPCDADCLTDLARSYMDAMVDQDPEAGTWADQVHFAENGVKWVLGDAVWGTASGYADDALIVPDPEAGTVAWIGEVQEHGLPAYYAMNLTVRDAKVASIDSMVARERSPGVFKLPDGYRPADVFFDTVSSGDRTPRQRMADLVHGYYATMQGNDGAVFTDFADDCVRVVNGVTDGPDHQSEADCESLFADGGYSSVESVRERQILAVDEARGLVVASAIADKPFGDTETLYVNGEATGQEIPYPYSRGLIEVFKIEDGQIARVESVSVFQPYKIPAAKR